MRFLTPSLSFLVFVSLHAEAKKQAEGCGDKEPDATAKQTMLDCVEKKLSNQVTNDKAALVDYDNKIMFIIGRRTGEVEKCVEISTGKRTGNDEGETPRGMMITKDHHGPKYQSTPTAEGTNRDCIGLKGTDRETNARAANGVIIHKAKGGEGTNATAGCVGVKDSEFDEIKDLLYGSDKNQKHSAIFIFTKETREQCNPSGGGGSGNSGRSDDGPQSGVGR